MGHSATKPRPTEAVTHMPYSAQRSAVRSLMYAPDALGCFLP
jgi:hypothetical protein